MTETCPDCGEEFEKIGVHWAAGNCGNPNAIDADSIVMFSGGHDSLVATHYCMENDLAELVLHLDTGTGLEENVAYIEDVCEQYGWPLEIRSAKKDYREFVMEYGFPSAAAHSWVYRYLKEHTLARVARDCRHGEGSDKPEFYTGVRKDESDRRMRTITDERQEREMWVWVAPIMDWSKEDCEEYIEEHGLPQNDVVQNIHRSGECFCGAFASRDVELIDLQAHYPDHAEWLLDLEKDVQAEHGSDEDWCWWGHEGLASDDLQELLVSENREDVTPMLCRGCEMLKGAKDE